ncbi:MAG TPA: phasin family protein [Aliidongia sp.]|nr:phasin family protein [Aliidongia sp.]
MTKTPPTPPFEMDVTKLLAEFKVPGVDIETVMATQRKNIAALTKANQLAIEGLQAVARRQAEILRGGIEEASAHLREMIQSKSPEDRMARQAEAAKKAIERALGNARELAEIVAKSGNEAFDVLNRRVGEGLDEMRDLVQKPTKK